MIGENYTACLDFYSDSILQIYDNTFSILKMCFFKGNGPNDFLSPFFIQKINLDSADLSLLSIVDLNLRNFKYINLTENDNTVINELMDTEMPMMNSCNMFSKYIIGFDVDMGMNRLFFIYNKYSKQIINVPYYPHVKHKYKKDTLTFLYMGSLIANDQKNSICVALKKMNSIQFYDFSGKIYKSIILGTKLEIPEANEKYLDFPDSPNYFIDICGTSSFVYCLLNPIRQNDKSKIFIFDWEGNFKTSYSLKYKIRRMAISPDGTYLLGLHMSSDGGTDVIRFDIP